MEDPEVQVEYAEPKFDNPEQNTDVLNISGFYRSSSTVPSGTPRKLAEQIVVYVSGGTKRLYIYDFSAGDWKYVTLT